MRFRIASLSALAGIIVLANINCKKDPPVYPDYEGWEVFTIYNSDLPESLVDLASDANGIIWGFGMNGKALLQLDGQEWNVHSVPIIQNTSSGHCIAEMGIGGNGDIWVRVNPTQVNGESGFFCTYTSGLWSVFNENMGYPSNYFTHQVAVDDSGHVWLASNIGLINYDGLASTLYAGPATSIPPEFIPGNDTIPGNEVLSVSIDEVGGVWAGVINPNPFPGRSALVYRLDTTMLIYDDNNSGLPSNVISDIEIDNNGKVWCITGRNEIVCFANNVWTTHDGSNVQCLNGVQFDYTAPIVIGSDNSVWFCTRNQGLIKYAEGNWINFTRENSGLPSNTVYDVAEDVNNDVWIATDAGLARFEN